MKMRDRAVLLAVLTALVGISGCAGSFRLATVPPGNVPQELRDDVDRWTEAPTPDLIWRAVYSMDGYLIGVGHRISNTSSYQEFSWLVYANGRRALQVIVGRNFDLGTYHWKPSEELDIHADGTSALRIAAAGWAFDRQAHQVIGTTTQGRKFEAPVVNGLWILFDLEVEGIDQFEGVVLQDQQGKILYTYMRTD